jgi:hypothetical protein
VTLAAAQSSVPIVAVRVSGSNVVLDPSGPIGAGPTRFTFDGRGEFSLATLRAGVAAGAIQGLFGLLALAHHLRGRDVL